MAREAPRWVSSAGGPLVLLQHCDREKWLGGYNVVPDPSQAEIPVPGGGGLASSDDFASPSATHYGKAAAMEALWAVVDFGDFSGIVLGDEPAATTWVGADDRSGGMLVRWIYAEDATAVMDSLSKLVDAGPERWTSDGRRPFEVVDGRLVLFDSFKPGIVVEDEPEDALDVDLAAGHYDLSSLEYEPNDSTYLRLHRLTRQQRAN